MKRVVPVAAMRNATQSQSMQKSSNKIPNKEKVTEIIKTATHSLLQTKQLYNHFSEGWHLDKQLRKQKRTPSTK